MKFDLLLSQIKKNADKEIYFSSKTAKNSYSYEKLFTDIKDIHKFFENLNLPERCRVGLMGINSYSWMVWNLALITSGFVVVNLTEDHFEQSADFLLIEYGLSLLISDRHDVKLSAAILNSDELHLQQTEIKPLKGVLEKNLDILSLVFSSGTTGHMKGLIISKSGTEAILDQFVKAFCICETDHYLSFLPFSYFQQVALNYCALFHGVTISIVDSENVVQEMSTRNPTYIIAPPIFHQTIHKLSLTLEKASGKNLISKILGSNIRFMITAMAPIHKSVIEYYWEGNVKLFETYAITETGMATWNTPNEYCIGTVGKEAEANTLKINGDGELLIKRNAPVSLGYFNTSKAVSEETFLEDGYLASGDIVEKDINGFYRIIGRKKHAIITQTGRKFHPEELENAIKEKITSSLPIVYLDQSTKHVSVLLCIANTAEVNVEDVVKTLNEINNCLASHKQILAAYITSKTLTSKNGYLTRNLKLNRKNLHSALRASKFQDLRRII